MVPYDQYDPKKSAASWAKKYAEKYGIDFLTKAIYVRLASKSHAHCKYIDCTQYSFSLCYVCHYHLAVHRAADGCAQLMAVLNLKCSQTKHLSGFLFLVVQTFDQSG